MVNCFNLVVGKINSFHGKPLYFIHCILSTVSSSKYRENSQFLFDFIDWHHSWLIRNNLLILSVAHLGDKVPQVGMLWYFWVNICNDHDCLSSSLLLFYWAVTGYHYYILTQSYRMVNKSIIKLCLKSIL